MSFADWAADWPVDWPKKRVHMHEIQLRLINFPDLQPHEVHQVDLPETSTNSTRSILTVDGNDFECVQASSFEVYRDWRITGGTPLLSRWTNLAGAYALGNALDHAAFADAVIDAAWQYASVSDSDDGDKNFEEFAAEVYWATSDDDDHPHRVMVQAVRRQLGLDVAYFDGLNSTFVRWTECSWAHFANDFKLDIQAAVDGFDTCRFHAHRDGRECPAAPPSLEKARAGALLKVDLDCVRNETTSPYETH